MSDTADIDRFVKDPSLLVELCRDVIDKLDASSEVSTVAEKEAQLRAISKAVEQLEKSCVAVPDSLRAEKTNLVASLALHNDAKQALAQLADEFQEILKDLRELLGQALATPKEKRRTRNLNSPKTPRNILREHILQSLNKMGGKARVADIIEEMGRQLQGKLLPGDTIWRKSTSDYAWQNNAKWERFRMTQDGTLRSDSPRGIWELNEGVK